jgi:hypothetical protein
MPPEHQFVIRNLWNTVFDAQRAIPILKSQIDSNKSAIATTNETINNVSSSSATIIEQVVSESIGFVNDQTGNTSYTTNQTDYGKIIILDDASPIAVTLSTTGSVPGIIIPFFCAFLNLGAGVATLTPDAGNINNTTSETLSDGQFAFVYYDGSNTWGQIATNNAGTITGVVAGTGLTGGGSSGSVTLAIANTAVTPASYTNANITVNQQGQITAAANGSGGGYSLGGAVSASNVTFGPAAGTGASVVTVSGLDGTHQVEFTTGSGPTSTGIIFTFDFTTSRGHNTFPVIAASQSFIASTMPWVSGGSDLVYSLNANGTALAPTSTYWIYVSAP